MPNTGLTAEQVKILGKIKVYISPRKIIVIGQEIIVNRKKFVALDPGTFFDYNPKVVKVDDAEKSRIH